MAKQRIIPIVYKVDYSQVDKSTQSVKKAEQATDKLNKEIKETETVGAKSFGRLKDAIIASGIIALAGTIAKKVFDIGVSAEQTTIAFTTFLGSAEKAKRLIGDLNKFAIITPYTNDQVNKAAKTLLAFGVEAKKIIPTLKLIGDVSAGTGKDLAEMAVIFGQIRSTGRLMGQDLLQLINAGFNPLQIISQKTGKSVGDLKKEMEKGNITFEMVEQAFKDATSAGGLFFNLMEKQSESIGGKISTLEGNFSELGKTFFKLGSGPIPFLVDKFNELVVSINQFLKSDQIDDIVDARLQRFREMFDQVEKDVEAKKGFGSLNQLFQDITVAINEANQELKGVQENLDLVMLEPGLEKDLGSAEMLRTRIRVLSEEIKGLNQIRIDLDEVANPIKKTGETAKKSKEQIKELADAMKFLASEIETAGEQTGLWGTGATTGVDPMFQDALKKLEKFGDQWSEQQESQYDREFNDLVEKNEKELEEIERAEANKRAAIQQSYDLGIQLGAALLENAFEQREIDLNGIRDKYDRELALAGDNDRAKEQIQLERDKKLAQAEQRNKEIQKKNARSKILIDTGVAIIKTFSQFGYPAGIIPAALMAALGAFQAGQINKYKDGVIDLNGPGTGTSDSIPAMLSKGESVMTAKETDSSMGILKAIRAKKLDDSKLERLYNRKAGGDGVAFSDKRIVEAIKGQKPPDYTKIGSYIYEVKSKNRDHKSYVRKKYISG